jgi:uncharacterized OB-fold protein
MTARRRLRAVEGPETGERPAQLLGPRSLRDQEFRTAVGAVDFAVDARYAWDTGVAVSGYLRGLKEGKILARECRRCRRVLVPPRMFCEQDFRPTDRWVEVKDTGRVNTFSICYVRWDMEPLKIPEIPAVIEIDGASPGIGFMHKLGEVDPDRVHVGMEIEAVWKLAADREGSILDIRYFRPTDPGLREKGSSRGRTKSAAPSRTKKRKR